MKNTIIKIYLPFFVATFHTLVAQGDVTMKQKVSSTQGGKTFSFEGTVYFQGKNMRMDLKPAPGSVPNPMGEMLVLSTDAGYYVCRVQNKVCNKMSGAFSPLAGRAPDPTKNNRINQVSISKAGKRATVAGFDCTYYSVNRDDAQSESCYSSAARAVFSEEMLKSGKEVILKMDASETAKKALLQEWELGIPLKSEYRMKGGAKEDKMASEVESIKVGAVSNQLFQLPTGYQIMDVGALMGAPQKGAGGVPDSALKQLKELQKGGNIPPEVLERMKNMIPPSE